MAQVQLYLSKNQRGYKGLGNINPSEDVARHIRDYSSALEILHYDPAQPQLFYLLVYVEEGLLFTILRPTPGALNDNYAGTLFFPHGIRIERQRFFEIIDGVGDEINKAADPGSESMAELRRLLAPDYGIEANRPHFMASSGHSYALAFYGGQGPTLTDYYEQRFYQPEYADYAGVLLLNALGEAKGREHSRDLTGPLSPMFTVLPPKASREGFLPHIGRSPFRRPIMAGKDSILTILWRRSGFESVEQDYKVVQDGGRVPVCDTSKARKIITPASFYITEQNTRKLITDCIITVNGTEITGPTPFTYDELSHASVELKSPGYFDYTGNFDLAGTTQALVQMRKLHKTYRFDMPLVAPEPHEPVRIYVKTLRPLTQCPIEGYTIAESSLNEGGAPNSLIYVGGAGRRHHLLTVIIGIAALLLGILIGWLAFGGSDSSKADNAPQPIIERGAPAAEVTSPAIPAEAPEPIDSAIPETTATEPAAPEAPAPATPAAASAIDDKAIADAVAYLDGSKKWRRAEMEALPALQGLFDDLNNYNFEAIKTSWAERLAASKNFKAVIAAVNGSATKRDPRTSPHDPTFNKPDDETINWRSYTYWVDP